MNENITIDRYFKKDRRCLAELLEIKPSYYKNEELTSDICSQVIYNRLVYGAKCNRVYDVFHLSPYEILNIKDTGTIYLKRIIEWVIEYCKNDNNKIFLFVNSADTKTKRLCIILNSMLNKEPSLLLNISGEEQKYIERFNQAIKVIPNELLFDVMNGSYGVTDLKKFLFRLYDNEEYIQELNDFLADTDEYISNKRVYSFMKMYCDKFKDKCGFLLRLPKKTLINELPYKLTDKEISSFKTSYFIHCFFKWLTSIDVKNIAGKIFDNSVISERHYDILKKRSNGETLEKIGRQYNCGREYIRYSEVQAMRKIRHNSIVSPYDFLRLVYAVNNSHNLTSADFEPFLDKEQTKILWYIIRKQGFDCQMFSYSKDDDRLVFDKDKA